MVAKFGTNAAMWSLTKVYPAYASSKLCEFINFGISVVL